MRSIITSYLPATDSKGARIVAKVADWKRGQIGRVSVAYDHGENGAAHNAAAAKLCDELGWNDPKLRQFVRGGTADGYVYVFACDERIDLRKDGDK